GRPGALAVSRLRARAVGRTGRRSASIDLDARELLFARFVSRVGAAVHGGLDSARARVVAAGAGAGSAPDAMRRARDNAHPRGMAGCLRRRAPLLRDLALALGTAALGAGARGRVR